MDRDRRSFLETALALPTAASAAFAAGADAAGSLVKDHFWLFAATAGRVDAWLEWGGVRGGSRMTPAEGAFYLDVPNLILVRDANFPPLPALEKDWKARTSFEQYAISFRPLKRVVWSVVGSGGQFSGDESVHVLELAAKYPNIDGVYFDDFFIASPTDPTKRTGALSVDRLRTMKERLVAGGRRLETWLTLYTNLVDRVPPDYLRLFDVIALWTWKSEDLANLERNLQRLESAAPGAKKALGCYLWDFPNKKPVPVSVMERQCELGLQWLKQGRVQEMVFLSNNVLDIGIESADWTREWIRTAGAQKLA